MTQLVIVSLVFQAPVATMKQFIVNVIPRRTKPRRQEIEQFVERFGIGRVGEVPLMHANQR